MSHKAQTPKPKFTKPAVGVAVVADSVGEGLDPASDQPTAFRWTQELQRLAFYCNWLQSTVQKLDAILDRVERLERGPVDLAQRPPHGEEQRSVAPEADSKGRGEVEGTGSPPKPQALTPKELAAQKAALRRFRRVQKQRYEEAQKIIEEWGPDGPSDEQREEYENRWMKRL